MNGFETRGKISSPQSCDRRQWLRASTRYAALAGLTLVVGRLAIHASNARCHKRIVCGECDALAECGFPEALAARREVNPAGKPAR